MIINELVLENVGPFRGRHLFDLKPASPDRPIVVFGGTNGAGKTTVFESIPLALYGQRWQSGVSRKEYEAHLADLVHSNHNLPVQPDHAAVELEFAHTYLDRTTNYRIRRSWRSTGKGLREDLHVQKDGEELDDLDQDHWDDFLKELIPRGVANLFFFDGEKVKDLAGQDEAQHEAFQDSFEALLGLDLIRQLEADLSLVILREAKQKDVGRVGPELERLEADEKALAEERRSLVEKRASFQRNLDRLAHDHDRLETRIAKEGGGYAGKRTALLEQRAALQTTIEVLEEQVRQLVHTTLPFAMAPTFVRRLVNQLEKAEQSAQWQAAHAVFDELKLDLHRHIVASLNGKKSDPTLKKAIKSALLSYQPAPPKGSKKNRHALGGSEHVRVLDAARTALSVTPKDARALQKKLEAEHRNLSKVNSDLAKAPDQDQLAPLVEEIGVLNRDIGQLRGRLAQIDEDMARLRRRGEDQERVRRKLADRLKQAKKDSQVLSYAGKVQSALEQYHERLKEEKRKALSDHLTECMRYLSNKGDYYHQVEIDVELRIKITTKDGSIRQHNRLSAGERQILATSLLWALAKTSGRPLPFVIDTPLGRLDRDHRTHLVERFFPNAAHQVLILSTDTEIDQSYFEDLEPWTSRSYLLVHDDKEHHTTPKSGYFWKPKVEVKA